MGFTAAQVEQLLRPIHPSRVLKDGKSKSHISQQDARAHLTRIFGFGGYDLEIDGPHLVFEDARVADNGKPTGRWDVCYRAKATLTIRDPKGNVVCRFEGSATDTAENQKRGEAHGLALRSAESIAMKRAATNLGDQFGLSLYNKGQEKALVRGTLAKPGGFAPAERPDMQDGIPAQVSLGSDEGGDDEGNGLPRNKDGSTSRSRVTDEELAANGEMTKEQWKEHTKLVKEVMGGGEPAQRDDAWTQGPPPPEEVAKYASATLSRPQQTKLHALFGAAQWTDRDDRLRACSTIVGRPLESSSDLTRVEAKTVIDVLEVITRAPDAQGLLTDYVAAAKAGDQEEMRRVLSYAANKRGAST